MYFFPSYLPFGGGTAGGFMVYVSFLNMDTHFISCVGLAVHQPLASKEQLCGEPLKASLIACDL